MKSLRNLPDIIEVKELMSFLNISRNTTYSLTKEKKLRSFSIGRTYKITKKSLLDYIKKSEMQDES